MTTATHKAHPIRTFALRTLGIGAFAILLVFILLLALSAAG